MTATEPTIDALPEFELPGVDGEKHGSRELQGAKAGLVLFLSCHCPFVHAYEDRIVHLIADFKLRGLRALAINSDDPGFFEEDGIEGMKERAKRKGYGFPYLDDEGGRVAKLFGATTAPEAFLFAADGRLRYWGKIDDSWSAPYKVSKPYLRQAVQALLAGDKPPIAKVPPIGCKIRLKQ